MNDSTFDDPDAAASESDRAHGQGWLPIREVTRQTGVNAVTLRAWERRYGLIVPQRTAKGHRLFSNEHVQRILKILTWLNRGVAVSQVKHLLDAEPALGEATHNDWHLQRQSLIQAIGQLAERQVDESVNQAMALYPPRTLCEHLLLPLLSELEQRWQGRFGMQMERVFFHSWLRSKFAVRVYHNNRQLQGAPLLLINHSDLPLEPHLWLCAWLISNSDCPVAVFDWPLPPGELALAVERLQARGVLLYASQSINLRQLPRLLGGLERPALIVGPAVSIHPTELAICTNQIANLHLAADPLSAHQALTGLGLL
ncbi:Transcriptional regulator, MerR family [Pseudomonas chlororaphis subsp. aurantiaca]|uniref:MerR family transcriptional regulator n=1 Tax=Pseudomonas chlororaphis TaxID=587753 RepID=UPI000F56D1FA|nr:MerR family transcriptional regulator [Pseudomonas chlororaphis]AZD38059.1 Transcriptional regulator, MerR family [Pseudomonas chlororaphis subsp. aurantiaca]AZD44400.1 Transcriptional regulator, MerR family [Pseudomonas chlororaphis subsp. aurantiaca]